MDVSKTVIEDVGLLDRHQLSREQSWVLPASSRIYLAPTIYSTNLLAELDGMTFPRAISAFDRGLELELSMMFPRTDKIVNYVNTRQALHQAKRDGIQFLVVPGLVEVENKLNSTSELAEGRAIHPSKRYGRDLSTFRIVLVDVYTENILDTFILHSQSRFFGEQENDFNRYYQAAAATFVKSISNTPVKF